MLVGELEPFIAALILALQVRGAGRLQVVEQRRVAGAGSSSEHLFAAREVAFGDLDHTPRQFHAGASGAVTAGRLANAARGLDQASHEPDREHEKYRDCEQHRDGHLDQVTAKRDSDVARVPEQEMRGDRTQDQYDDDDGAEFHCADPVMLLNRRNSCREPEISGMVTANIALRISPIVARVPSTWVLSISK